MTEQLVKWNTWYDHTPVNWRFLIILVPLLVLGAVNMLLTVSNGFPFALLVVLGIALIAVVRVPYSRGWIARPAGATAQPATTASWQLAGSGLVGNLNRRYEAMPEDQRFWVFPTIFVVAGAINMLLTIGIGFPFGLLLALVLLAVVAIRAPYVAGLLGPSAAAGSRDAPIAAFAAQGDHAAYAPQSENVSTGAGEAKPAEAVSPPVVSAPETHPGQGLGPLAGKDDLTGEPPTEHPGMSGSQMPGEAANPRASEPG